jgi:hypothetical protein
MGMGTRQGQHKQEAIWIANVDVARSPGHPFYQRLNALLDAEKNDLRGLCLSTGLNQQVQERFNGNIRDCFRS